MKGIFRIGGALVVGIIIILGALSVQTQKDTEALTGQIIVSQEPNREYIQSTDADGDGIKDWEKSIETFKTIDTPIPNETTEEPYVAPTTLTGRFSEAFLKDYLEGKINGEDFSDPTLLVDNAIKAIDANSMSIRHNRSEILVIEDSPESLHEYGNDIALSMKIHSINNEHEMTILQKAITANDPALLAELEPIRIVYAGMIADTLKVGVPQSLVAEHINLLNAYEAILTDIKAMQVAFTDPLYSLARVRLYEEDATALYSALESIHKQLSATEVSYTSDEAGSMFYIFDS